MVFQSYALYPHMSVRENLAFGLRLRKTPNAEVERLVNETAKMLGSRPCSTASSKQLSGRAPARRARPRHHAQARRLPVRRAASNLDAKLRVQMRAEIKKLQNALQTTPSTSRTTRRRR
jgi:multiple sugar transport system ATP-binding protein